MNLREWWSWKVSEAKRGYHEGEARAAAAKEHLRKTKLAADAAEHAVEAEKLRSLGQPHAPVDPWAHAWLERAITTDEYFDLWENTDV